MTHLPQQEQADKGHVVLASCERCLCQLCEPGPVALGSRQQQQAAQVLCLAQAVCCQVQLTTTQCQLPCRWMDTRMS